MRIRRNPLPCEPLDLTAVQWLEIQLSSAAEALDEEDRFLALACTLAVSPKENWIEQQGGLPEYICRVARAIVRRGKSVSNAIQMAIGTIKNWAHGKGDVDPDTRAKAAAALAEWTAMKARAKAS